MVGKVPKQRAFNVCLTEKELIRILDWGFFEVSQEDVELYKKLEKELKDGQA